MTDYSINEETFQKINEELSSYKMTTTEQGEDQASAISGHIQLFVAALKDITEVQEVNMFNQQLEQVYVDKEGQKQIKYSDAQRKFIKTALDRF